MLQAIYHEEQEARLCAMHALNNLLQGSYFSEVDLMQLATQLDEKERSLLDDSPKIKTSQNVSDEGDFSIGVIQAALEVWGLTTTPIGHPSITVYTRENPWSEQAYICNHREHWFVFRKFGNHWFNLNSTLDEPEYLSQTYISLFIEQLKQEGYSIFTVRGELPQSEAELLSESFDPSTIKQPPSKKKKVDNKSTTTNNNNTIDWITQMQEQLLGATGNASTRSASSTTTNNNDDEEDDDAMIQQVLALSRRSNNNDDDDLEEAIRKSLQEQ